MNVPQLMIAGGADGNFTRNFLENYNDSEHAVKTKNAPFFMNFPNFTKMATFFPLDWSCKHAYYWVFFEV